jgi:light-independent protochlorophyllide reductase subunit L
MRLATELWEGKQPPCDGKALKDRDIFDLLGFD